MIDEALIFLRDHLNAALKNANGAPGDASTPDVVAFIDGDKGGDSISFTLGAVSAVLVKLEEENTLRRPDLFARTAADGNGRQKIQPDIRMNLYVLFVAHFKQYADSLRSLSGVIRHFQRYRIFHRRNAPTLPAAIEQLAVELVTLPFAEQNEVWGSLRTSFRPSVLYRVRVLVFQDDEPVPLPVVEEPSIQVHS